jgi:hypothetical protein
LEPPELTPQELTALIAEAVSWLKQQRETFLPYGIPLSSTEKTQLQPFFTAEILELFRIVRLWETGKTVSYPSFYEKLRAGGARLLPDPLHSNAMPIVDVGIFNSDPTLRTIFHTLVHVAQVQIVGLERYAAGYVRTISESGLWMVVPFEEQAYQMDARYTGDPTAIFSVEEEVREWVRAGRF